MTESLAVPHTAKMRFPAEIEAAFQKEIYDNSRNFLRGLSVLFFMIGLVQFFRFAATQPRQFLWIPLAVLVVWSIVFSLTFLPEFWRCWQPVVTLLLAVGMCALEYGAVHNIQVEVGYEHIVARVSWFSAAMMMFMVSMAPVRLSFRWATLLYCVLTISGALQCLMVYDAPLAMVLDRFSLGVLVILPTLLYLSYAHERLHRDAFLARHWLAQKEEMERKRRQKTETMLHVLSQAIGGIVHDLGNPLTLVQSGADLMEFVIKNDGSDSKTVLEILATIQNGAQMLNHLRLSLMEQTRVLEGKPIPVELRPIKVRSVAEVGLRYQQPKIANGRSIVLDGPTIELSGDEMKLATVFMNLIGNALKYSDGTVRVTWQRSGERLFMAVQDQGRSGSGLTRDQAANLFVAFGRLEMHEAIEGTGLGLLSVQKIVEAHGGEVFVAGYATGAPDSPPYNTSHDSYPFQLDEGFVTAFVVTCPAGI